MTTLSFRYGQKLCPVCLGLDGLCPNCQVTLRGKCIAGDNHE